MKFPDTILQQHSRHIECSNRLYLQYFVSNNPTIKGIELDHRGHIQSWAQPAPLDRQQVNKTSRKTTCKTTYRTYHMTLFSLLFLILFFLILSVHSIYLSKYCHLNLSRPFSFFSSRHFDNNKRNMCLVSFSSILFNSIGRRRLDCDR